MSNETIFTDEDGLSFSQEDILNFTRAKRISFVRNIEKAVGPDEGIATLDPERQSNYLAALRDLEKLEVSLMKIKQDEKSNEEQNAIIAALVLSHAKKQNAEQSERYAAKRVTAPNINEIPHKQLIPGETDIGDRIEKYAEYKTRVGLTSSQDPLSSPSGQ